MLEKTAGQIIEAVTAKLDSPQGQRKLQQLADHHERIARSRSILKQQLRRLGKRPGVAFYGSVGSLTERKVEVDVRLLGRSCGSIQLVPGREGRPFVAKNFKEHLSAKSCEWHAPEVRKYLDTVRPLVRKEEPEVAVESALLVEMAKTSSATKSPFLLHHQPVKLLGHLPFQFPLPISARNGIELASGPSAGHADVLARHRNGRRLRVFEVKKERGEKIDHALAQAVSYCAALEYVLKRSPSAYLSAFGMTATPRNITFEAVAFVPVAAKRQTQLAAERLARGGSRFGLMAQFFRWEDDRGSRTLVIEAEERYAEAL